MLLTRRHALMYGSVAAGALAFPVTAQENLFFPENFGADGDGKADDAAALNACDRAAATSGGTVVLRNTYRTKSQLLLSAPWRFERSVILRDWTGDHGTGQKDASATIKGRGNDPLSAFYVNPGPYRPRGVLNGLSITGSGAIRMTHSARNFYDASPRRHATMLYILCDNFRIEGVTFELGGNDWCICFGGDGFRGGPFKIEAGSSTTRPHIYEDGFHVLFGRNGGGYGWDIESGDDSISFGSTMNLPISGWTVRDPRVFSHNAFGIKIAAQRLGATAAFGEITQAVEHIAIERPRWAAPHGRRSRNGYVRFDAAGAKPGIIRNCRVSDGDFQGLNNGLPIGASSGVSAVSFAGPVEDCTVHAHIRHPSLWAALMTADEAGGGPIRSGFDLESPDLPNWAGARGVKAVAVRSGRGQWVRGRIAGQGEK